MTSTPSPPREALRRQVVSFTRRGSRMNPQRRRSWEAHRATFVLDVPRGATSTSLAPKLRLVPEEIFGRSAPLVVEVGCGDGESLVPMAERRGEVNVLAFEVFQPAMAKVLARLSAAQIDNVRLVEADGVDGLAALPEAAVTELWTYFPDPWPKARHHKRRLVSPSFADLVATRLGAGARWRLATDDPGYAEHIRLVLDGHEAFAHAPELSNRADRPVTKFERRAGDAGRAVSELCYRRR